MEINSTAALIELLEIRQQNLSALLLKMNEGMFKKSTSKKWSVTNNVDHLIRSTDPITIALILPKFSIGLLMGKAKKQASYDEIIQTYKEKLANGAKSPIAFTPKPFFSKDKKVVIKKWNACINRLIKQVKKWPDADLDTYRIPHPILGKISFREMLYFTAYHIEHHTITIKSLIKA